VIVENLRFLLMAYSPEEKIYLGAKYGPIVKQVFKIICRQDVDNSDLF